MHLYIFVTSFVLLVSSQNVLAKLSCECDQLKSCVDQVHEEFKANKTICEAQCESSLGTYTAAFKTCKAEKQAIQLADIAKTQMERNKRGAGMGGRKGRRRNPILVNLPEEFQSFKSCVRSCMNQLNDIFGEQESMSGETAGKLGKVEPEVKLLSRKKRGGNGHRFAVWKCVESQGCANNNSSSEESGSGEMVRDCLKNGTSRQEWRKWKEVKMTTFCNCLTREGVKDLDCQSIGIKLRDRWNNSSSSSNSSSMSAEEQMEGDQKRIEFDSVNMTMSSNENAAEH